MRNVFFIAKMHRLDKRSQSSPLMALDTRTKYLHTHMCFLSSCCA